MVNRMIKWIKETVFNIKMRVKYGNNLERTDNDGKTPLMNATNAREATWLLEHGAKWDAEDDKGNNALWHTNEEVIKTIYDFLKQKNNNESEQNKLQDFLNHKNHKKKSAYEDISECLENMQARDDAELYTEYTNKKLFLRDICGIDDSKVVSETQKLSQSDESKWSFSTREPCQQSWVSSYHQIRVVGRWSLWGGTSQPSRSDIFPSILTFS